MRVLLSKEHYSSKIYALQTTNDITTCSKNNVIIFFYKQKIHFSPFVQPPAFEIPLFIFCLLSFPL